MCFGNTVIQQCSSYFLVMLNRVVALVLFFSSGRPDCGLVVRTFYEVPNHVQHDVCIMLTRQVILEDHLHFIDDESGTERLALPW